MNGATPRGRLSAKNQHENCSFLGYASCEQPNQIPFRIENQGNVSVVPDEELRAQNPPAIFGGARGLDGAIGAREVNQGAADA